MSAPVDVTFNELVRLYCETQNSTPEDLKERLYALQRFNPDGLMLLECQDLWSSQLGQRTILPFGGSATFKEPPTHPISPRGLASDMSTVKAIHWLKRPQP